MGDYFPNGIIYRNGDKEDLEGDYEHEFAIEDNFRCYQLACEDDLSITFEQSDGYMKSGMITFFHLLFEYAPEDKKTKNNEPAEPAISYSKVNKSSFSYRNGECTTYKTTITYAYQT